jgi:hypothetical protein
MGNSPWTSHLIFEQHRPSSHLAPHPTTLLNNKSTAALHPSAASTQRPPHRLAALRTLIGRRKRREENAEHLAPPIRGGFNDVTHQLLPSHPTSQSIQLIRIEEGRFFRRRLPRTAVPRWMGWHLLRGDRRFSCPAFRCERPCMHCARHATLSCHCCLRN